MRNEQKITIQNVHKFWIHTMYISYPFPSWLSFNILFYMPITLPHPMFRWQLDLMRFREEMESFLITPRGTICKKQASMGESMDWIPALKQKIDRKAHYICKVDGDNSTNNEKQNNIKQFISYICLLMILELELYYWNWCHLILGICMFCLFVCYCCCCFFFFITFNNFRTGQK